MDSQCPGCLGQAIVTLQLPCAIVESPRRHRHVPFVNIASTRSRSIKRHQRKHKLDYYGVVFFSSSYRAGCGINAKDPSGLDSDRWIPHSRCCENPARPEALAGFSRHLSAGFTDLNPAPRGFCYTLPTGPKCVTTVRDAIASMIVQRMPICDLTWTMDVFFVISFRSIIPTLTYQ